MKSAQGFTLIEVLVAMVILAGALLGLASLQAATLRNAQSAYFRSVATQLAYDMSDRMRSNPAGVANGNYNNTAATADDCSPANASPCTAAQMAGFDLAQWNSALAAARDGLPNANGTVCIDSTPDTANCDSTGRTYAIKVSWDDDRTGVATQFVMSFEP